jgi:hypothetical protein
MDEISDSAGRRVSAISVDCLFEPDGQVRVRRIGFDGHWQSVGQGRQWLDENGRHVLIMLPNQQTAELRLRPDSLSWELIRRQPASSRIYTS